MNGHMCKLVSFIQPQRWSISAVARHDLAHLKQTQMTMANGCTASTRQSQEHEGELNA